MKNLLQKLVLNKHTASVLLALIILAGGVLRLRYFETESPREVTGYYSLAVNLKTTGVLAYPGSPATPTAYRAPLYPAFLSIFAGTTTETLRRAFLAQLFLYLLAALLVWYAAQVVTGSGAAALAAAAIYAFHPGAIAATASTEIEFFYGFLLAAVAAAMALAAAKGNGWKYWVPAFCLAGISVTCKSPMALFPALLAAWLYFSGTGGPALKRKLPLLLALAYLALLPWTIRNAVQFKAFIPLERNASLCNIYSAGSGMPGTCLPSVAEKLYRQEGRGELYAPGGGALPLLGLLASKPGIYLKGFFLRLPLAFGAFPVLFILSAAGAWSCRKKEGMLPLALFAAYFTGVHLVFSFEARYLIPALPLLAVLAAAPAGRLFGYLNVPRVFASYAGTGAPLYAACCVILPVYALAVFLLGAETLKKDLKPLGPDAVETLVPVGDIKRTSGLAAYLNQKGVLQLFSGNFELAEPDLKAAIKADPSYPDPYLNLAYAQRSLGSNEAALQTCLSAETIYSAAAATGVRSYTIMTEILTCQAASLNALGRKKEASSVAARIAALELKTRTALLK